MNKDRVSGLAQIIFVHVHICIYNIYVCTVYNDNIGKEPINLRMGVHGRNSQKGIGEILDGGKGGGKVIQFCFS